MPKKRKKPKTGRKSNNSLLQRHINLSLHNEKFIDRDLSWLEFNSRVLAQAEDVNLPLLERMRFVSIFQSNLDEFFMKRMVLLRFIELNLPGEEVKARANTIRGRIQADIEKCDRVYHLLSTDLKKQGIEILQWEALSNGERGHLTTIFKERIFPILTPIAVDPGHPFPHISNLSMSLGVALQAPGRNEKLFSRVKIPKIFPQLVSIGDGESRWIFISDVIENNLSYLFPKMEIKSTVLFRVTRNIEIERDEEVADDLMAMIENELRERRFGEVVKVELPRQVDPWLLGFLKGELELFDEDFYFRNRVLDYSALSPIFQTNRKELLFPPWKPIVPKARFDEPDDLFSLLREKDILVHHPYQSFSATVEQFVQSAVNDPHVLGIKLTLYRTEENSSLIKALIRAAEAGKQVVCIVELKARFDEERNITWANALEEAGVHVIYGIVGLKTHAKVILVARREDEKIRCYAHIGTGNYNSQTAKLYTDFGLFTGREEITAELIEFFHFLTGRSLKSDYKHLLIAPVNMKDRFIQLIRKEAENKKQGKNARIIIKCNNIEDFDIGEALYEASKAGVQVDLIVRTICTLRPEIKGLSDNIRVVSIVDRFLEHSRVFFFQNSSTDPEDGLYYLGSADLMFRNLLGRVEVITPILDKDCRREIYTCLDIICAENTNGWKLSANGSYKRLTSKEPSPASSQQRLMEHYSEKSRKRLMRKK